MDPRYRKHSHWETWLNTPVEYGLQSIGWQGWYEVEGPNWLLGPFSEWVNTVPANQNRTFVCSIPMITQTGTTLEEGAAGSYNSTWYKLANLLKSYNLTGSIHGAPKTILRFGWEFDGLFPWSVKDGQQTAFINYWRIMTEIFRSVDPTFQTMWNGQAIWNSIDPFSFYPGDDYVTYVAIDIYDRYWINVIPYDIVSNKRGEWNNLASYAINDTVDYLEQFWQASTVNTNKAPYNGSSDWKIVATASQLQQGRIQGWNQMYTNNDNNFKTLTKWSQFARNHSKQVVLQEWAGSTGSRGGGDNTYFIQQIYDWVTDPVNNVAWQSWYYGGDQEFFIFSPNQTVMDQSLELKNVSKLYKELFGTPLPTTSSSSTGSSDATSGSTTGTTASTPGDVTTATISGITTLDVNGTSTNDMSSNAVTALPSIVLFLVCVFLL